VKRALEKITGALGWTVPPDLAAVAAQLGQSAWPEMVERWSRLTPTGFPIKLTVRSIFGIDVVGELAPVHFLMSRAGLSTRAV
jgi:hypothetical protein